MKSFSSVTVALVALPAFVAAQSSSATPSGSVAPSLGSSAATSATSLATTIPVSFSLFSTNPSAVPLSSIIPGQPPQPTTTVAAQTPGATPSYLPKAPGLPNLANVRPASYPALDVIPPTNSPEVAAWIQEVKNSGVPIPNITQTVPGGCPANLDKLNDGRCWWTCGGCTRESDVTTCPDKYTWGMTYDDGPAYYTPDLLKYLDSQNLKATIFAVGSRVISFPQTLQAEYMSGHQIGVHTWSHHELTGMTNEQIIAELGWSRKVIKDVLGVTPNTWRPPFGDIDDRVRNISLAMGLRPVMWTRYSATSTFDTGDFNINAGTVTAPQALSNWEQIMANASLIDTGFIVLEHDLFEQCVDLATGYIIPDALARSPKLSIKPVIECLNRPMSDAYVETNNNQTNPPPASAGAAATLASGAPGSVQSSGGSSGGQSSPSKTSNAANKVALFGSGAIPALVTAALGAALGAAALLL